MKKSIIALLSALLFLPIVSLAAFDIGSIGRPGGGQVITPVTIINNVINKIVWPVTFFAIIVLFILAGFSFITAQGDPAKIEKGRFFLMWGIIGVIFIIASFSVLLTLKDVFGIT